MKKAQENKFTLGKLLIVMAILFVIVAFLLTAMMPQMYKAREDAFRVEATKVVNSAKDALKLYGDGELSIDNSTKICKVGNKYCFTISELQSLGLYKGDLKLYSGKVEVNYSDSNNPIYVLFLKKGNEFKFIGETRENYTKNGVLSLEKWNEKYNSCTCTDD